MNSLHRVLPETVKKENGNLIMRWEHKRKGNHERASSDLTLKSFLKGGEALSQGES